MRRIRFTTLLVAGALLVGCESPTEPAAAPQDSTPAVEQGLIGDLLGTLINVVRSVINILAPAPNTPPLETYSVNFWAVRGQAKTVQVNYQMRPGESRAQPFMRIQIPADALFRRPNGSTIAVGDSIRISVNIERDQFLVHLQPHGLVFRDERPLNLKMWYRYASLPLGLDERRLDLNYQPIEGLPWITLGAEQSTSENWVSKNLNHFSNYAVAW
jgi:hypothetical protein